MRRPSSRPARIRLEGRELAVGSRHLPLYSGALHYFRLPRDAWRPALRSLREIGFEIVESYVPWGVHETAPGAFDFGDRDPKNDLGAFLDLAAEEGLLVFLRPGPHINAEMTCFGLPERIVHDKACQARSPRQNPVILGFPPQMFPVPSYASSNYHAEVGRWFDAVAEVIEPRIHPRGPVVLLQVDNEAAYYFRNGPYDQDYHPDALALFRKYLEDQYRSPDAASAAHRRRYATWDDVAPPERFDAREAPDLVRHLDWAAFLEQLITDALVRMRRRMAQAGLRGVPIVHNVPLGDGGLPVSLPDIARAVDLVGLDYYHAAREHRTIKRRTLALAGTLDLAYAPELGAGAPPWFTPLTMEDSLFTAMAALAYGLRGFNLYMAVDRDRWYGAPIDAQGSLRPDAAVWKRLLTALKETRFHDLRRKAEVALLVPREYARLSRATHLFGPISPSTLEAIGGTPVDGSREDALGFPGPIQVLWWRMLAKVSDALTRAGVPYVYVDSAANAERLAGMKAVVSPTYEYVDPARWDRLAACAAAGAVVVHGPAVPRLDERMEPFAPVALRGARQLLLDTPEDARRLVDGLVHELGLARPYPVEPAPLETAVHEDDHGPRVLFVVHPGKRAVDATITLPAPATLVDLLTGEELRGESTLSLRIAGHSCRMLGFVTRRRS